MTHSLLASGSVSNGRQGIWLICEYNPGLIGWVRGVIFSPATFKFKVHFP